MQMVYCRIMDCDHNSEGECQADEIEITAEGICLTNSEFDD